MTRNQALSIHGDDGVTSVVSVVLMVAVTIVVAVVLAVGAMTFLPDDGEETPRPEADFSFERDDGALVVDPQYMSDGTRFDLLLNGQVSYSWEGNGTREQRRVTCLNAGDRVAVRANVEGERTYLIEDRTVSSPTGCGIGGTASRFTYARVGARQVPLKDTQYEFTLSIDPDGPDSVNGDRDYPSTNPWVYVQRYDRTIEGFSPPVYVVVFADNVGSHSDWQSEPSAAEREEMTQSYQISGDSVDVTASGVEPTDDVYMVFKPDCTESEFKFVRMQGGYNNQILLDGTELFRTDAASPGTVYSGPGVDCT